LRTYIVLLLGIIGASTGTTWGQATTRQQDSVAKVPVDSSLKSPVDSVARTPQKDLIDIYHQLFKKTDNVRAEGKFHNAPFPAVGYTLQTGFAAVMSDNLAFYSGDPSTSKESDIASSITYSQYNQIIAQSLSSIWTKGEKYNFIADWRYMKYPSTTFGLGGHTQYSDGYTIDFSYLKLHTSVLRHIAKNLYAGLGFYYDYFWNIKEIDPPAGVVTSFEKYGLTGTEVGAGPAVRVLYDSRINPLNAFNGWYVNAVYHPSFVFLGSQTNWASLQVDIRKYIKLRADARNILAFWSFDWFSVGGKTPYLLLPSTGWDDSFNTGRGYIQGRYRGADMAYLEMEDRFTISRNGLIGGVVFINAESFKRDLASQFNSIAPGYGAGIRLKLNKHSGANICVDYGFGLDGSRGVSVNLGEVF
jgi:hypothetical protein